MNSLATPDARKDAVRVCVEAVEHAMERLPSRTDGSDDSLTPLRDAWRQLVLRLDLGPAPELRNCPTCGMVIMRAATLCGHCWRRLTPGGDAPAS